ncbi:hypothetical protein C0995_011317 [Termitomyces sp. Mi166|nr:hypothetical protein C0995_011317 [Termitomyces sp. Mi166\
MASAESIEEKDVLLSRSVPGAERNVDSDTEFDAKLDLKVPVPNQDDSPPDPRFNPPIPSPFKRAALIAFTIILFWIASNIRTSLWKNNREDNVVYASRYSKEHKFRPAASPIITETLKDGRVRIRGAAPTATPVQTPTPIPKKPNRRKTRKGKALGKKSRREKVRK